MLVENIWRQCSPKVILYEQSLITAKQGYHPKRRRTAVYALLAAQSLAQSDSQEFRKVVAVGEAMDPHDALQNAFKVAVEQAVGTLVDSETIVREDDTIQEKILSVSNGFIKSYNVIRQWTEEGLCRCRIEALVEIRELQEHLEKANISTLAVSGPNLAARVKTETSAREGAAAILSKRLNRLGDGWRRGGCGAGSNWTEKRG
jgi:hypothetical protein